MNNYEFLQSFLTGVIEGISLYFFVLTLIALVSYTFARHSQRVVELDAPQSAMGITAATLAPIFCEPDEPKLIPQGSAKRHEPTALKDFSKLTAGELKKLARSQKIPRYGSLSKAKLIELLTA